YFLILGTHLLRVRSCYFGQPSVDLEMKFPEGAITFGGRLRGLALHALGRLLEIGLRIQSSRLHIFSDAFCPDRLTGSSLDRLGKAKGHGTGNDRGCQDCLVSHALLHSHSIDFYLCPRERRPAPRAVSSADALATTDLQSSMQSPGA